MAAKKEVVETTVWLEKRMPADDPSIAEGDWRDPDAWVRIDGARMVSGDEHWRGHEEGSGAEPDWSKGCWLESADRTQKKLIEFAGDPGQPFKRALLDGLVGVGVIVFRDEQRHN